MLIKKIDYLGVKLNYNVNEENILDVIPKLLEKGSSKIYTVNPEFIVDAYYDIDFLNELNSSDLNIIDGIGLLRGVKKYFKKSLSDKEFENLKTFTGVDLTEKIFDFANSGNLSVFILGGDSRVSVAEKTIAKIKSKYPSLKIFGSSEFNNIESDDNRTLNYIHNVMQENNLSHFDFLLVGYGHKKQEFWISRNMDKVPAKISVGVGGTFDYISGNLKRAPLWIRKLGLEWLFRLFIQPQRILRVFKATFIFSYLSSKYYRKKFLNF